MRLRGIPGIYHIAPAAVAALEEHAAAANVQSGNGEAKPRAAATSGKPKGRPRVPPLMSSLFAGLLIGTLASMGLYALAATAASTLAANFTTGEVTRHGHAVKLEAAMARALAAQGAARERCVPFAGKERKTCAAAANARERNVIKRGT